MSNKFDIVSLRLDIVRRTPNKERTMSESGTGSTVRELTAWGSFIIMASLFAWYAVRVIADPASVLVAYQLMIMMIIYIVVAHIFLGAFVGLATSDEKESNDERDKHIAQRASRYSEWVLGAGVVLTIFLVFAQQATWLGIYDIAYDLSATAEQQAEIPQMIRDVRADMWRHPIVAGHALVTTMVMSELVRYLTIAVDYRTAA